MSDFEIPVGSASNLKQKLLEALQSSAQPNAALPADAGTAPASAEEETMVLSEADRTLEDGRSVYSLLMEPETDPALPEELRESQARLQAQLRQAELSARPRDVQKDENSEFDGTLSMRGAAPRVETENRHPPNGLAASSLQETSVTLESVISGGSMADLSGYKDLSKAPMSFGDEDVSVPSLDSGFDRAPGLSSPQHFVQPEAGPQEVDTEFSGNVKTLIRLVNELPEGVTKQTGAQIIRLTMEAMGISMEDVLSEAQSAQSEMLDAVRANIKKIEEYKTVIRKLETDIKYYQGKANELSEIIDLFILSNTSGQKMPGADDLSH